MSCRDGKIKNNFPRTHTHRHSQANEEFLGPRSRCPKPKEEKSFRRSM